MLLNLFVRVIKLFFTFGLIFLLLPGNLTGQNLLFKSGFEKDVKLEPPVATGGKWKQVISGTDNETGFRWPHDLPTRDSLSAFWDYKVPNSENLSNYVETRIDEVISRDGNTTKALLMSIEDYDPTNFDDKMQGHVRCEYKLLIDSTLNKAYIKYWMKLQPNLYEIMRFETGRWRMIMEWFESGDSHSDYRWSLHLRTGKLFPDSLSAHWRLSKQFQNGPGNPGDFETDTVVNYQAVAPVDEWFQVEVFWNQQQDSTGRIWFAINNETIFDLYGPNLRDSFINNWQIFKLYTDEPSIDDGLVYQWIDDVEIWDDFPDVTWVDAQDESSPETFHLMQNYPNPFNPATTIKFTIPSNKNGKPSTTKLVVFDALGREVATLVNKKLVPGNYEVTFDGSRLSSGVYFYTISNGSIHQTKKMILIK